MWWPRQQSGRRHSDFARRALRKQAHAIKQGTTYNFCEHAATPHCLSDCCHVCSPLDHAPPKDFVSTEAVPTPNREFYTAIRLPSFGQPWSCVGRRCRPAASQILCRESGARGFVHFPCMFQSLPCGVCPFGTPRQCMPLSKPPPGDLAAYFQRHNSISVFGMVQDTWSVVLLTSASVLRQACLVRSIRELTLQVDRVCPVIAPPNEEKKTSRIIRRRRRSASQALVHQLRETTHSRTAAKWKACRCRDTG